ncbi:hypothetical protein [Micromonospora tarensis]|uniref:hypothetical protein n=1 Tax=Micromonospora tarensis TaxID=2806100 RepID=UPI0028154DC2|nr:hypothetical protein [Micromonospora tarensis]
MNVTLAADAVPAPVTTAAVAARTTVATPSVTDGRGNRMSIQDSFTSWEERKECRRVDGPAGHGHMNSTLRQ